MKALRSARLNRVLADPKARAELQDAVVRLISGGRSAPDERVTVRSDGQTTVYRPVVVPYPHSPTR